MTTPNFADETVWTGDNLQLLCAHCNRVKGDRVQEYLVARLRELGMAA